eukprot:PhM_4_TR457/c2_g1_i1/m.31267
MDNLSTNVSCATQCATGDTPSSPAPVSSSNINAPTESRAASSPPASVNPNVLGAIVSNLVPPLYSTLASSSSSSSPSVPSSRTPARSVSGGTEIERDSSQSVAREETVLDVVFVHCTPENEPQNNEQSSKDVRTFECAQNEEHGEKSPSSEHLQPHDANRTVTAVAETTVTTDHPRPASLCPTESVMSPQQIANFGPRLQAETTQPICARLYHVHHAYRRGILPSSYVLPYTRHLLAPYPELEALWVSICVGGHLLECGIQDVGSLARDSKGIVFNRRVTPSYRHVSKSAKRHMIEIINSDAISTGIPVMATSAAAADTLTGPTPSKLINDQYVSTPAIRGGFLDPPQQQVPREVVMQMLEDANVTFHAAKDKCREELINEEDQERELLRLEKRARRLKGVGDQLLKECYKSRLRDDIAAIRSRDRRFDHKLCYLIDTMELSTPDQRVRCVVHVPEDAAAFTEWVEAGSFVSQFMGLIGCGAPPNSRHHDSILKKRARQWVTDRFGANGLPVPLTFRSYHDEIESPEGRFMFMSGNMILLLQQFVKCTEKFWYAEKASSSTVGGVARARRHQPTTRDLINGLYETVPAGTMSSTITDAQLDGLPSHVQTYPELITAWDMRDALAARQSTFHPNVVDEEDAVCLGLQMLIPDGLRHHRHTFQSLVSDALYCVRVVDQDVGIDGRGSVVVLEIVLDSEIHFPDDFPYALPPAISADSVVSLLGGGDAIGTKYEAQWEFREDWRFGEDSDAGSDI